MKKRFEGLGIVADSGGPAVVASYISEDVARWSAIIRERNIQAE